MGRYNLNKASRSTYRAVANQFLYEEWQKEYLTFAAFEGPCHGPLDHFKISEKGEYWRIFLILRKCFRNIYLQSIFLNKCGTYKVLRATQKNYHIHVFKPLFDIFTRAACHYCRFKVWNVQQQKTFSSMPYPYSLSFSDRRSSQSYCGVQIDFHWKGT